MMIEFSPPEPTHDCLTTLEMPMPPRVGETIKFFVQEEARWGAFEILAVRYQQMEQERTIMATRFGMVDCVAAICTVKEIPEDD